MKMTMRYITIVEVFRKALVEIKVKLIAQKAINLEKPPDKRIYYIYVRFRT